MADRIHESGEDYLEAILRLENVDGEVRSVDVATYLSVTRPSVSKAISTLKDAGMVDQELYGNIKLTKRGRQLAVEIDRKHRVLKSFLINVLNINEKIAELDACRIEHIISEETFSGFEKLLKDKGYEIKY